MSSDSTEISGEDASDIRLAEYLHLTGLVFLYYDHILTLSMEVRFLQSHHKGKLPKYLLVLNRYFSAVGNLIVTYSLFSTTLAPARLAKYAKNRCRSFHLFREVLLLTVQIIVCLILSLRIWAIYHHKRQTFGLMLTVGLTLAGLASFSVFFGENSTIRASITGAGCHSRLGFTTSIQAASAWVALFLYDSMLLTLLFRRGYQARREVGRIPILELVLRDGALYYVVMTLSNLANILTFYLTGPFMRGGLSTFSSAMSVTMMSRLTFHLHQNVEGNRVETYELEVVRFAAATVSTQEQSEDHVPQRLKSPKHSSKRTVVISR